MARASIADLVDDFNRRGDETAFVYQRGYRTVPWTYSEVGRVAAQFSSELQARGFRRGDRVILLGANSAEWVAAFLGCALFGAVAVPLDKGSAPGFIHKIEEQVAPVLVVGAAESHQHFDGVPVVTLEDLPSLVSQNPPWKSQGASSPEDILEIIFTSGTTAEPKGVVITHANVLANLEPLELEIEKYRRYEKPFHPLRFMNLLPLSHVFGQFLSIFVPQSLGAAVVFHESLNPAEIISSIRRHKVNLCVAVPHILTSLKNHILREYESQGQLEAFQHALKHWEKKRFPLRWWKFRKVHSQFGWRFWAFVSGGSALNEADERFWSQLAFAVIQGYGLTETTSLVTVNHPFHRSQRSIGKLLPGREVKLAPDGEILVRGKNVAMRYWRSQRSHSVATEDGWFPTGDLGALDAEGNLYFKGRKKNVIVTPAGMNVHPEDLEQALRLQPGVRDVVVVGLPVAGNAEPFAVLLMRPDSSASSAVDSANRSLAEFQRIQRFAEWPEADFPRTPTQKPLLGAIEQFVCSRAHQSSGDEIDTVLSQLAQRSATSSAELNLSSMQKVELMAALENKYQVDLSEVEFAQADTVHDLEELIKAGIAQSRTHVYPRWPRHWPFTLIRFAAYWIWGYPATLLLAKPKVIGRENLRSISGPVLIVCNHVTIADIGFVLAALPPAMRTRVSPAMQGEMLASMREPDRDLSWFRRAVLRFEYLAITALFNVFPLPQTSALTKSFAFAGEIIDAGNSVLIFPEGRRTTDGEIAPFQSGIGILAARIQVPVLPLRIDGLFEAAKTRKLYVPPGQIKVHVGTPSQYQANEDPTFIAKDLERRVREL